ncbi:YjbH domain-containing protein [Marinobacter sp. SS21]|uniref:YjbH domain-containing protein n=1 Tax=Marinobacter sp. SS21 TaxID=2979460 RepID=UPI00232C0BE1|nr:YjbH domain-containing protein [Marinobacter sp. SS21]MDC0661794.1 YjbH domain-containing protein [Marinobacter sp. SS21]
MTSKHSTLVSGAVACLKLAVAGSALSFPAMAQNVDHDLAFPGYSGFLNVPSATALAHGQADIQFSDQSFYKGGYDHIKNVSGTFGVFPYVEVGGRLAWAETHSSCFQGCGIRDLSANVKVQAPLIPHEWFDLAVGIQDLGGEVNYFDAKYIVAGRQFGPVEFALGYGDPDVPNRYLDGAFGAVSFRPFPWLNFIAEHDSQDLRVGAGVTSPRGWLPGGTQVKAKVVAYNRGEYDDDRRFAAIGISIPFGNAGARPRLAQEAARTGQERAVEQQEPADALTARESVPASHRRSSDVENPQASSDVARNLGEALVDAGYERVRVASVGDTLHVRWENNLYNRDERDSLYDVASRAQKAAGIHGTARLTLLNQGLPVVNRTVSLGPDAKPYALAAEFAPGGVLPGADLTVSDWDFEGSFGPAWKPRLTFRPNISSTVGTEYGVWDASVALGTELSASLWPGALVSASYNTEFYSSEDFEKGGVFFDGRQRTGVIEAEIQQSLRMMPWMYTSVHAGRYAFDYRGALNETLILSPSGHHSLGFIGGYFQHREFDDISRRQALARYSYFNPGLDLQLDVYGGQFFAEDTGVRVDSRFWFGDYAVTLQYKNTDAEFVSLGWVIPLTPVKDHQFRYLQLRGDADWSYSVQTRINDDLNYTAFGGAGIVQSANPLREVYLNRGRFSNQ